MKYLKDESIIKNIFTYVIVGAILLVLYFCLRDIQVVKDIVTNILGILRPFFIGGVIAYLLRPIMNFFENYIFKGFKLSRKFKHSLSVICAFVTGVICLIIFAYILVPQLVDSVLVLANNLETYIMNFEEIIINLCNYLNIDVTQLLDTILSSIPSTNELTTMVMNFVATYLPNLVSTTMTLASVVMQIVVGVIIAAYILLDIKGFARESRRTLFAFFSEKNAKFILYVTHLADRIFNDFIGGKILDSLIIGILCFVIMSILKWPFPLLISVIVGVTNIIPFFGPFIGAVPGFLIVLVVSPITSIWFLIFILLLQQFDGNVLGPKILGDSIGLPAIWIIFSILIGGGLFGFIGMVVGVPVFGVIYFLFKEAVEDNLARKKKIIE